MSAGREATGGINILVFEGGGARGLSSLIILNQIMDRLQHRLSLDKPPKVREYFEIVAGTGTGAVIACMVGRLGISVKQAFDHYLKLAEVFSDRKRTGTPTYKMTKLQEVLKRIIQDATGEENSRMMDKISEGDICKTMVFAMSRHNMTAGIPRIFRSYKAAANQMPDCMIWEAVSASMAHPELFNSVEIGDTRIRESFVDGGFGCNNPTAHTLAEVKLLFPGRHVSSVVCIGAGHPDTIQLPKRSSFTRFIPINALAVTKQITMDAEKVSQEMAVRFRSTTDVYFRFRVDQGMQQVGSSEWERLDEVTAHSRAYMHETETNAKLDRAVSAINSRKATLSTDQIDGEIRIPLASIPLTGTKMCPAPTPLFTGRQDRIDQIKRCIINGDNRRCVFVLHGLGGAGKTQLVLKTVEDTWDMWTEVLFVDATSRETIVSALEVLAKSRAAGQTYQDILRWLTNRRERWLLIFDNVDNPAVKIKDFFPTGNHGSLIITTRIPGMSLLARGIDSYFNVSTMGAEDALELLVKTAGMQKAELPEVEYGAAINLLKDVGYLPLAIVQAGAYIRCSQRTICQYLDVFTKQRRETLEKYTELPVKVDDYQKSVYTTWYMSYKLLSIKAQRLLHLMAFMHHTNIVEDIFRLAAIHLQVDEPLIPETDAETAVRMYVIECLHPYLDPTGAWDSNTFLDTMTELLSYSLINYDRTNAAYTLHVLLHDWASTVVDHPRETSIEHTMLLLAFSIDYKDTMESLGYKRIVEVHVSRILEEQSQPSANNAARFAEVYYRSGKWKQKERMEQIEVDGRQRSLGEEHSLTLTSMANLALAYQKQGKYEQAATLHAHVVGIRKRMFGDEHDETLTIMGNLAVTYNDLGRYKEAESLQLQIVDTRKRVRGEQHTSTLASMHDLALTYLRQRRYEEAEALLLPVVETSKQVWGNEHPTTLAAMNTLGSAYRLQARYEQAELLQLQVLELRKRRLGDEHPDTLSTMNNLALTYCAQDRLDEAEALQLQILKNEQQTLGEEHPHTLTNILNLAYTYWRQGRYEQAEKLQLRGVEGRMRIIGAKHPYTLLAMHQLLATYKGLGAKRRREHEILRSQIEEVESQTD